MKKLFYFAITIMFLMVACTDQDLIELNDVSTIQHAQSPNRSIEEAMEIAQSSIKMLDGSAITRSASPRKIDLNNIKVCKLNTTTRSGEKAIDTLMYVFNFADNEGFAMIAAPRNVEALLAITESGSYDPDEPTENEGFKKFVDMAKVYVEKESRLNMIPRIPPLIETLTTLEDSIHPLVTVKWGQCFPEGLYCPNTKSGCVSTAAIQIFSYYQYPTSINLTFPQRERDVVSINWTDLKTHYRGGSSYASHTNCQATVNSHKVIGELARQCVEHTQALFKNIVNDMVVNVPSSNPLPYSYTNYTEWPDAFTATYSGIPTMMVIMGYDQPTSSAYTSQCTMTPLNSHKPILMEGGIANGGGRHAWVVDGYLYYKDVTTNNSTVPATFTTSYRYYNHINWGWYGSADGYFLDGVFATNNAFLYDNSSYGYPNKSFTDTLTYSVIER